jgi:hypothetical protein
MAALSLTSGAVMATKGSFSVATPSCSSNAGVPSSSFHGPRLSVRPAMDKACKSNRFGRGNVVMTATLPPKVK